MKFDEKILWDLLFFSPSIGDDLLISLDEIF